MIKILKVLLAISCFLLLFSFVDFDLLWKQFSAITWPMIGYLMLISFVMIYVSVIKWQMFLDASNLHFSTLRLYRYYLVSYFVNLLLPSFVGGDLARSSLISKEKNLAERLAATFMERVSGLLAMMILAIIALPWLDQLPSQILWFLAMIVGGFCCGLFFAYYGNLTKIFVKLPLIHKYSGKINSFQTSIQFMFRQPKLLAKTLLLSLLFHCLTVVNTLACAWAVDCWSLPVMQLFLVVPIILLIAAVPITPSGLGLQEGACFYFLTMLGASPSEALAISLILRAKSYVLAILGGVVLVFRRRGEK